MTKKYCIDCARHVEAENGAHMCLQDVTYVEKLDLVTGECHREVRGAIFCKEERESFGNHCGPDARFFKVIENAA